MRKVLLDVGKKKTKSAFENMCDFRGDLPLIEVYLFSLLLIAIIIPGPQVTMHQLSHLFLPRSRRSIPFYPTAPLLASPIHRWHGAFSCVRPTVQLSVHSAKFRNFAISTLRRGALSSNSLSHSVNSWHSVLYILYRCSNMKPRPSERERLK